MAAVIEFKLNEIEALAKKLNAYTLSNEQRNRLLNSIGTEVIEQSLDRFDTERDPEGGKWRPWSEKYARYMANHYGKSSILQREGMLMRSFDRKTSDFSILVGATLEYAAVHQFGYSKKNIPARPYLGLSSGNIKDLETIIDGFLGGRIA